MNNFQAYRLFENAGQVSGRVVEMSADELDTGNVVIRTAYASINYKDALAAAGINKVVRVFPRVGGGDLTGTVIESQDPRFSPGDQVAAHGSAVGTDHDGGFAQIARLSGDWMVKLPAGLSLFDAASVGMGGYTAALSIHLLELNGLTPAAGRVLVTGASGGVATLAIDLLGGRGYDVVAATRKAGAAEFLRGLGAAEILDTSTLAMGKKPMESARWAGALDSVGGEMLSWITRTMQPNGVIAAFGNAGGMELNTRVLRFILRGVRLIGVNVSSMIALREMIWARLGGELKPRHLQSIVRTITLDQLDAALKQQLRGEARGRTVVNLWP